MSDDTATLSYETVTMSRHFGTTVKIQPSTVAAVTISLAKQVTISLAKQTTDTGLTGAVLCSMTLMRFLLERAGDGGMDKGGGVWVSRHFAGSDGEMGLDSLPCQQYHVTNSRWVDG